MRLSEGHKLGISKGAEKKCKSEGSPVTTWRLQREKHIRTWKESDHMRGTHKLVVGIEEGGTWP